MMEIYGADRFFWASDYPHPDHSIDYLRQMETLVDPLPPDHRAMLLGENVARCYGLDLGKSATDPTRLGADA
jgi:predicted TIM-barrel fold metal-dependent hydrolase